MNEILYRVIHFAMKQYWLMKSEPTNYSIDDLAKEKKCMWDGVRNYQARNFMMKDMTVDDEVLFYHSNATPPGIFGLATVSKKAVPDDTQFDKKSKYFDKKATPSKPIWYCVCVKFKKKLNVPITLPQIKLHKELRKMVVAKKGSRLSIQPVTKNHYSVILSIIKNTN